MRSPWAEPLKGAALSKRKNEGTKRSPNLGMGGHNKRVELAGVIDLSVTTLALLAVAGFCAGWVDAIVGGGGLLQLPALLLVPGMSPLQALATNKLGSVMGTSTSALTYYRRINPDMRTGLPMAGAALVAAIVGARLASLVPGDALRVIILCALVLVAGYTIMTPNLGVATQLRWEGTPHLAAGLTLGAVLGLYDGLLGPGTGTFLVLGLVSILGYAFLPASAIAKVVNLATNVGALIFFIPSGAVIWSAGLVLGVANMVGGYTGARMAISRGVQFIRVVFLIVVATLIIRLAWDVWG